MVCSVRAGRGAFILKDLWIESTTLQHVEMH